MSAASWPAASTISEGVMASARVPESLHSLSTRVRLSSTPAASSHASVLAARACTPSAQVRMDGATRALASRAKGGQFKRA
eukprot:scaffold3166_cov399-Prasinococcus_capsulatus_cf.AAC.19